MALEPGSGTDRIVNYRMVGRYMVVDRILERASLIRGSGDDAWRVNIRRQEQRDD